VGWRRKGGAGLLFVSFLLLWFIFERGGGHGFYFHFLKFWKGGGMGLFIYCSF
jgi:hypothetical protein